MADIYLNVSQAQDYATQLNSLAAQMQGSALDVMNQLSTLSSGTLSGQTQSAGEEAFQNAVSVFEQNVVGDLQRAGNALVNIIEIIDGADRTGASYFGQ